MKVLKINIQLAIWITLLLSLSCNVYIMQQDVHELPIVKRIKKEEVKVVDFNMNDMAIDNINIGFRFNDSSVIDHTPLIPEFVLLPEKNTAGIENNFLSNKPNSNFIR